MYILTPTDFSEIARRAADVAGALAGKRGATVRLVHSLSSWIGGSEFPVSATLDELALQQLAGEAERLQAAGISADSVLRHGSPGGEVQASAKESEVGMIVLGSGDPAAGHHLAGSVAEQVAEAVPVPTLVVRRPEPLLAWLRDGVPLRVLCAMDFSLSSDAALAALRELAALGPVSIEAVHFARPGEAKVGADGTLPPGDETALQRDVWQRLHRTLGDGKVTVHIRTDDGHAPEALARLAGETGADLVVLGTRQVRGLRRLAVPSFSRGVLTHASTNVMCVPIAAGLAEAGGVPAIRRVLVAAGFAVEDARTLRHACGLVGPGAAMRLVHACPAPSPALNPVHAAEMYLDNGEHAERARVAAEEKLLGLRPPEADIPGVAVSVEAVIHPDASVAICEAADRFDADVICMGSRGHSRLGAALLGSVAQAVIAGAHRPVLVVPPPRA
jgi:nucleotide-binding universal stress UspA family protein